MLLRCLEKYSLVARAVLPSPQPTRTINANSCCSEIVRINSPGPRTVDYGVVTSLSPGRRGGATAQSALCTVYCIAHRTMSKNLNTDLVLTRRPRTGSPIYLQYQFPAANSWLPPFVPPRRSPPSSKFNVAAGSCTRVAGSLDTDAVDRMVLLKLVRLPPSPPCERAPYARQAPSVLNLRHKSGTGDHRYCIQGLVLSADHGAHHLPGCHFQVQRHIGRMRLPGRLRVLG